MKTCNGGIIINNSGKSVTETDDFAFILARASDIYSWKKRAKESDENSVIKLADIFEFLAYSIDNGALTQGPHIKSYQEFEDTIKNLSGKKELAKICCVVSSAISHEKQHCYCP